MLTIEEIDNSKDFDSIREQWDELLARTPDHSIFQTYDYMRTWWEIFGKNGTLRLLIIKNYQTGEIIAIIPLYRTNKYGFKVLQLLGDTHADYLHFLLSTDGEHLSNTLANYLKNSHDWDVIYQNSVVEGSLTNSVLKRLNNKGFEIHQYKAVNAPKMRIAGSWHNFYETLDKRIRKDTERQLKRLEEIGELAFINVSGSDIRSNLNIFFKMHKSRWQVRDSDTIFDNYDNRRFYEVIAEKFDKQGLLDFSKLMINDEILAVNLGFIYKKQFYYYIPAFNIEYSKFSVGRILILELIKKCFREKLELFDFMAGEEEYKYKFSNTEAKLVQVYLINRNIKGFLYNLLKFKVKPLAKKLYS